mmetsp:Transcript_4418/g.3658  ORF Transcript_4418/g.3658 Transcript_4418/m.3658 type:complete len:162 (+) Transcript_4418:177-662(+)|eukprot:CAMPEP_0114583120 /NCGR_PEP_ID=MMETSP0125-20121206/6929_1 /TAXON_ID=485358 ORGANISM="Aristerostoma sp., Strain ATCC 50986" /NCGR_SAMPLE_ID=MMETSP0125 /ASSEMBLY_ACC=CAM_ASM_000245 /LENGTH=161 /DNA_ID=CAMNT_0001776411 /DNA_START=101 /DNA_END=586 /DNA_ORIENTATION=+
MLVVNVKNPATITTVAFFLNKALPDDLAGTLNYSIPPYENLQFLGAISNNRPSDIFNTGFSLNPSVNELTELKFVIKAEPLESLKEIVEESKNNEIQKEYPKKVAQNLYNYLSSYNKKGLLPVHQEEEFLVIPTDFFDKWIVKFEEKYKHDPNFIMKSNSD